MGRFNADLVDGVHVHRRDLGAWTRLGQFWSERTNEAVSIENENEAILRLKTDVWGDQMLALEDILIHGKFYINEAVLQ